MAGSAQAPPEVTLAVKTEGGGSARATATNRPFGESCMRTNDFAVPQAAICAAPPPSALA
jgi:hypothetical protein